MPAKVSPTPQLAALAAVPLAVAPSPLVAHARLALSSTMLFAQVAATRPQSPSFHVRIARYTVATASSHSAALAVVVAAVKIAATAAVTVVVTVEAVIAAAAIGGNSGRVRIK